MSEQHNINTIFNNVYDTLIGINEVLKVQLYHYYNTGYELSDDEILMKYTNTQILGICDKFDTRLLSDFPVFAMTIAALINLPGHEVVIIPDTTERGIQFLSELEELEQISEELEFLEAEHTFVSTNTTELVDDMPDCKKRKY